jgi:hypothetical protein
MKKLMMYPVFLLIVFLSIPFLRASISPKVFAATPVTGAVHTKAPTPTPTPARVEYALPYPGMLPDSPFYFLKNLRDKIIELLISDPVNKAQFYILQADKKLNMGITLSSMGKSEETQEVLAQSLTARTQAVTMLETLAQSGKQAPAFVLEKMALSLEKHKEVLTGLKVSTEAVDALLVRAQHLLQQTK